MRLACWLTACCALFGIGAASAKRPTYALQKRTPPSADTTIRVYDSTTGRTVWRHRFPGYGRITWAKDRRAVAFETGISPNLKARHQHYEGFQIVTWRARERIRFWAHYPFTRDDYVEDFLWSPDDTCLLFRTGGSGESDLDMGGVVVSECG